MVPDEELIGYALQLLEPDDQSRVAAAVVGDPLLASKLARLRQALAPLALAHSDPTPPPGLASWAIARVAEQVVRHPAPEAEPPASTEPITVTARPWPRESCRQDTEGLPVAWRPMELLVASCLILLAFGLAAAGVQRIRHDQQVLACQNQMRQVHAALTSYSSVEQGRYPQVGTPTVPTAGEFAQELRRSGHLASEQAAFCPESVLAGPFAYTLGYRTHTGSVRGLTNLAEDWTPLLADLPSTALTRVAHSTGQNVLFVNGAVRYSTSTQVGLSGDDIYVNDAQLRRAGLHVQDTSLGILHAVP